MAGAFGLAGFYFGIHLPPLPLTRFPGYELAIEIAIVIEVDPR
jgi:hypothetical protein